MMAELSKAWQSVPYLSLALIVSAWTIGVFGLSILLDDCWRTAKARRTPSRSLRDAASS